MKQPSRRKLLAVAAGVAAAAILLASAASLGGLTLGQIGAENDVVTGFEGGVTVTWGDQSYNTASKEFTVDELTLTTTNLSKPFPTGHEFEVVLTDTDGSTLYRASKVTAAAGAVTVNIPSPGVPVEQLTRVAISLQQADAR